MGRRNPIYKSERTPAYKIKPLQRGYMWQFSLFLKEEMTECKAFRLPGFTKWMKRHSPNFITKDLQGENAQSIHVPQQTSDGAELRLFLGRLLTTLATDCIMSLFSFAVELFKNEFQILQKWSVSIPAATCRRSWSFAVRLLMARRTPPKSFKAVCW